ncbi:hypothetical protein GW17_00054511 [Ensete ventricosum]|nr:hypothetical protein GW17_00054511 [Ensete ventricosum]
MCHPCTCISGTTLNKLLHRRREPPATLQLAAPASAALQATVLVGAYRSCGLAAAGRPLWRRPWPQSVSPLQVAKPWPTAPVGDLAVAGRPSSSLLRLQRKGSKNA